MTDLFLDEILVKVCILILVNIVIPLGVLPLEEIVAGLINHILRPVSARYLHRFCFIFLWSFYYGI